MRFKGNEVQDGEWVQPLMNGFKLSCCDCGLTHDVNFVVFTEKGKMVNGMKVQFQVFKNKRSTAQRRRWKK